MSRDGQRAAGKGKDRQASDFAAKTKLELEQRKFKLARIDYIAASLLALAAGVWIFFHIGTANNWDDLLYMSISQHTVGQTWILNRYGHIYLQKFFFWFAGDTITGGRIYWSFLISATAVLVYWCARILAGKKSHIIAVIAVLLFCMQPIFGKEAGSPLSDFTVMFLVMSATFIYLAFLGERGRYTHLVIMLLGLIFFWAVKSKELGICMGVLFLGLGQDKTGLRSISRFIRDIGWVCLGMLAGCVLLMALDLAFMGDALFSVRFSNVNEVVGANLGSPVPCSPGRVTQSWYSFLTTRPIFIPFLLYLLVGWRSPVRDFSSREKVIWLAPLVLLVFLTFVRKSWYIVPRYFSPVIPILCIWAAQFFWFEFSGLPVRWRNYPHIPRSVVAFILVLAAFVIVCIFMPKIPAMVEYYKLNEPIVGFPNLKYQRLSGEQVFYMLAIIPSAFTGLLIVAAMSKRRGLAALFFSALCLFALALPPLASNISSLNRRLMAQKSQWRFEPFRVFKDELRFDKDTKILVLRDIHKRSWMLGRNAKANCHMLNIFFNGSLDYDQVVSGGADDILKGDYTYAFLTARDWRGISEKHNVEHLLRDYEPKTDRTAVYSTRSGPMQLILLKKR